MEKYVDEDYWNEETQTSQDHQEAFGYDVANLMKHLNQTGGECTTEALKEASCKTGAIIHFGFKATLLNAVHACKCPENLKAPENNFQNVAASKIEGNT
ncbi:hypothetical protein MHYP_G00004760 [Metynnis hypsauchen]